MPRLTSVVPRLPVADLARALAFYTDVLGFRLAVAGPSAGPTFALVARDGVELGFYTPDEDRPAATTGAGELSLTVDDAVSLHDALKAHTEIEWGPEVYSYGRREFAVRDPDGYLLIFSEPTDDSPTGAVD